MDSRREENRRIICPEMPLISKPWPSSRAAHSTPNRRVSASSRYWETTVLDVDHEDLAGVGDPHPGALKRRPASGHGLIVKEHVHDTPALTSEGRQAMDSNTRLAGNLPQPGQLARPVLENHCQVCGHRIFDPSPRPAPG